MNQISAILNFGKQSASSLVEKCVEHLDNLNIHQKKQLCVVSAISASVTLVLMSYSK